MFANIEKNNEKANLIFQCVENLKLEGFEKSFKMAPHSLLANRFLLGINCKELTAEKIFDICKRMNMPEKYLQTFKQNLPEANIFLLGFEQNEKTCVYKVYLEFWDKIRSEIYTKVHKTDPVLLYLGFKWDTRDNTKGTVAEYTTYPLLPVGKIVRRLSDIYDGYKDSTSFEIVKKIIDYAAARIVNHFFIYLEVSEENNPRKSFDINLYKARLPLKELYPLLSKMRQHYAISSEQFDLMYNRISTELLGHLSGGIDREGKDFLTTYYEVAVQ